MNLDTQATSAGLWLPAAQFRERHQASVAGEPSTILDVVSSLDDRDDALVRSMIRLREMPSRLWGALGGRSALKGKPRFSLRNFTLLERSDTVLVLGLAGQFWRLDFGLAEIPDAEGFRFFSKRGVARLVMTFLVEPCGEGEPRLITETYVHCPDAVSLVMFAPYWAIVRLSSGLIRRRMLQQVQQKLRERAPGNS